MCPLQTRFPFGSAAWRLNLARSRNSPDRSTKSTRSHALRGPTACRHRVSGSLSLPSRGPFHLSFTVLCSIGHQEVFSLAGWSPLLPTGFPVSRGTPDAAACSLPSPTGLSPSPACLPRHFRWLSSHAPVRLLTPACSARRFGLLPFRSPLLRKSMFLSFPPAT